MRATAPGLPRAGKPAVAGRIGAGGGKGRCRREQNIREKQRLASQPLRGPGFAGTFFVFLDDLEFFVLDVLQEKREIFFELADKNRIFMR
jgi:hypothetical protein